MLMARRIHRENTHAFTLLDNTRRREEKRDTRGARYKICGGFFGGGRGENSAQITGVGVK